MASDETGKSQQFTAEARERIRADIRVRGMTFEVFLPESIAIWLREKIAAALFSDLAEAAFVAFQEMRERRIRADESERQVLIGAKYQCFSSCPRAVDYVE